MNLTNLVVDFCKKVDVNQIESDKSSKIACNVKFDKGDWKVMLDEAIEISVNANPPKGYKTSDGNKIILSKEQKEAYANRVVGEQYRYHEALRQTVLDDIYKNFVAELHKKNEKKIDYTKPKFTLKDSEDKIEYLMEFDALEDLPDFDLSQILLDDYSCAIQETDVDLEITEFLEKQIKEIECEDKDYIVQDGDVIVVDFIGKVDNMVFEGGTAKDYKFEVGAKTMLPDFEDGVRGMKLGGECERNVKVRFPENYQAKGLAGLEADFKITLKKIFTKGKYDNVNEFVEKGSFGDVNKFRDLVKQNVDSNTNYMLWILKKDQLLDKLDEFLSFELPQIVVENELNKAKMNFMQRKAYEIQMKSQDPEYNQEDAVASMKESLEKEMKEMEEVIKAKVKISMFLNDVARKNKIDLGEKDLMAEVDEQAKLRGLDRQTYIQKFITSEEVVNSLRANAFENKILKFIIDKVNLNKIELTRDEAKSRYEKIFEEANN